MAAWPSTSEGSAAAMFLHRSMLAYGGLLGGLGQRANQAGSGLGQSGREAYRRSPAITPEQVEQCRRVAEENSRLRHIARVMTCSPATVR